MAKLLERIRRANAGEGARIGFGVTAGKAIPPRLALIVRQTDGNVDGLKAAIGSGADAVLLDRAPSTADLEAALEGSDKCLVGLNLGDTLPEDLPALVDAGLDFIVLTSTNVPVRTLRHERLTIGLHVPAGLEDGRLRALAGAPGAFVMTSLPGGDAPTVEDLIELRRVGLFLSRPILAEAAAGLDNDDLAALRDNGLCALVVGGDLAAVADLRQRLNDLPQPIKQPGERATAVLPAIPAGGRESE